MAVQAALFGRFVKDDLTLVQTILSTKEQRLLFKQMSANDQRHALAVVHTLQTHPEFQILPARLALLQAGLLHDVGKSLGQPIIHRVLIVLLEASLPALLHSLSTYPELLHDIPTARRVSWWRRPFVIHAQHPTIGATWTQTAMCEPLVSRLIARHQQNIEVIADEEDYLLYLLQWADNSN